MVRSWLLCHFFPLIKMYQLAASLQHRKLLQLGLNEADSLEKNYQIFQRIALKSHQVKKGQNISNKDQFENPKHLETTFETLKYLQQTMF